MSSSGAHWEEAKQDFWTLNTDTRSTAATVPALSRADPKNPTLASAVRWLMAVRTDGHWATTQETAWAVLALTEYMQATKELGGSYSYQVQVNGKPVGRAVRADMAGVTMSRNRWPCRRWSAGESSQEGVTPNFSARIVK